MAYRDTILAVSGLQSFWELEEAAGATSVADSKGTVTGTPVNSPTFGQPGLLAEGGSSVQTVNSVGSGVDFGDVYDFADTIAASQYLDPNADGASTAWTKSTGTAAWSLLNDAVRQPTAPTVPGGNISTSTSGALQDVAFPDTLVWASGDTYKLWVYANTAAATKRKIQAAVSTDDGTSFATAVDLVAAAGATGWYSLDISGSVTSQATLNGLRSRLSMTTTGGGSSGTVTVYALYVERIPASTPSPFTFEAWVKPNLFNDASGWTVAEKQNATAQGWRFEGSSTVVRCDRVDSSGVSDRAAWSPGAGEWVVGSTYHLVYTYDGSTITLYVNGVSKATQASTRQILDHTGHLCIGRRSSGGTGWDGWLDAVAVYNRALTATEVATNHTAGATAAAAKSLVYDERRVRRNSLLRL